MRLLTVLLVVATALPVLGACERHAPHEAPAPEAEERAEPREPEAAPQPAAEPREEPAPDSPAISIEVNLGAFDAHAFPNLAACSLAALTVSGEHSRCRSNCQCIGVHRGPQNQQECMLSCSSN